MVPMAKRTLARCSSLAAGSTSLRRVWQPPTRALVREAAWSLVAIHVGDCTRERARTEDGRGSLRLNHQFRMRCPQGNLPAARAFLSYASGTVQLAPCGWLRGGMARNCRGCRHGPVCAVRSRLDPGGSHRGAVEETSGPHDGPLFVWCRVTRRYGVVLAQLSVAHIQLRLAVPLASRATG